MQKIMAFGKRFGFSLASLVLPILAKAASPATPGPAVANGGNATPSAEITSVQSVLNFVCTAFGWMFYFLIALAVVFVVIAAYRYLTSGGNPEKTSTAGKTIMYAAIAVAVALLARAIPLIVADFLGANNTGTLQTC
jgi:hypothetical protein